MADFNKVMLMGNLTRDPEVRYTPSGMAVSDLGLAVNRMFKGSDGQPREETCFVRVTVWARQAENCAQYLKKGSPVFIEGRLKYDEWEKDGQKQSRLSVVGERVQFLSAPRSSGGNEGGADGHSPPVRSSAPRAEETEGGPPPKEMDEAVSDEDDLPF